MKHIFAAILLVLSIQSASASPFWIASGPLTTKWGMRFVEIGRAKSLQACRRLAMDAYAHAIHGPIMCSKIVKVDGVDVYGELMPVE